MNTVYANILYKGHGKDKTVDSSYRTISTCPLIAKSLDTYIGELSLPDWHAAEPETQFQGAGKSNELAALLLSETIHHSLVNLKKPVFALFLDARSAFDKALFQILGRRLFLLGTDNQNLSYIIRRLENRITFCEWEKVIMGPINDELGLEQGGKFSSEFYKIYNAEQLTTPQDTGLGTHIGDIHIASIGQADDTVLVSHDLYKLKFLLHLTLQYCTKFNVELSSSKTKLQVYTPPNTSVAERNLLMNSAQLVINGSHIQFVDTAEHVGILRSIDGNIPHILNKMTAHNRALYSILSIGLSRSHKGNPAASIRVEKIYGLPVLLSGTPSLSLKTNEVNILNQHYKTKLQQLQKLYDKTPEPVIYFLAGSLPAEAILHLRQLSLFSMITRLPNNILNKIAKYILTTSKDNNKSWFVSIAKLCFMYGLPHPLTLLEKPLSKSSSKSMNKMKVLDYWQSKLRLSSSSLDSLKYFKPEFYTLSKTNPLWPADM